MILNPLQDYIGKGDVLPLLVPFFKRGRELSISNCGKINNIKDISWMIEKSKQVGIKSEILMPLYKNDNNTGRT